MVDRNSPNYLRFYLCMLFYLLAMHGYAADSDYLKALNAGFSHEFGTAVSTTTNIIAVGAPDQQQASGAVYLYETGISGLMQAAMLKAENADNFDGFGHSVSIAGNVIVIGAPSEGGDGSSADDNSLVSSGAAYVFEKMDNSWMQTGYLKASNPGTDDLFGWSVATDGETIAVGAKWEDSDGSSSESNDIRHAGAVYVFSKNQGEWQQQSYLKSANPTDYDSFGSSVAVDGDNLIAGAPFKLDAEGSVFAFRKISSEWQFVSEVSLESTESGDQFGWSVGLDADRAIVGAIGESSDGSSQDDNSVGWAGAAFIFRLNGADWVLEEYLKPRFPGEIDQFGYSVELSGDFAVVGARLEDGISTDPENNSLTDSGAAYIFIREGSSWPERAYLKATFADSEDLFGSSVSIASGVAAIGVPWEDSEGSSPADNSLENSGAAYTFDQGYYDRVFKDSFELE